MTEYTLPLSAAIRNRPTAISSEQLLVGAGARVILGEQVQPRGVVVPVVPSARTLFGPRGASLMADGSLWVADTGHHRLLGWPTLPAADGQPATWLIGQPDFERDGGRNAHGPVGAASLNVPTGICPVGNGMAVADVWNHRVLIWNEVPHESHAPADLVLGQSDFVSAEINRGAPQPSASSLYWPYGVSWDGARLYVADSGNRRVLWWEGIPTEKGQPADGVLGQADFHCRDENGGHEADAMSMRWPHAVTHFGDWLAMGDAGNNRVLLWRGAPQRNGQVADMVLGQPDFAQNAHNRGNYFPNAACFNMPYGVTATGNWLIVADTANSRLLGWQADDLLTGAPARTLAGQDDFQHKGDNRWGVVGRNTLCWPYGISAAGRSVIIADSGNNRVLLWDRRS